VADMGGDMSASCKPRVQCSLTRAIGGRIVRYSIISSCQSAATSEIVKALLATSSSHVRSAIASSGLYFYVFLNSLKQDNIKTQQMTTCQQWTLRNVCHIDT